MEKLKIYNISGYEYDVFEVKDMEFYQMEKENDELWVKWKDCEALLVKLYGLLERRNEDEACCILEELLGLGMEEE